MGIIFLFFEPCHIGVVTDPGGFMSSQHTPSVLRIAAAAKELSVSESTIRRWAKDGRLRIVKLGVRASGVLKSDIDAFLAEISQS